MVVFKGAGVVMGRKDEHERDDDDDGSFAAYAVWAVGPGAYDWVAYAMPATCGPVNVDANGAPV